MVWLASACGGADVETGTAPVPVESAAPASTTTATSTLAPTTTVSPGDLDRYCVLLADLELVATWIDESDPASVETGLMSNLGRMAELAEVAPPEIREDVARMVETTAEFVEIAHSVDFDLAAAVDTVLSGLDPEVEAAEQRLDAFDADNCPPLDMVETTAFDAYCAGLAELEAMAAFVDIADAAAVEAWSLAAADVIADLVDLGPDVLRRDLEERRVAWDRFVGELRAADFDIVAVMETTEPFADADEEAAGARIEAFEESVCGSPPGVG